MRFKINLASRAKVAFVFLLVTILIIVTQCVTNDEVPAAAELPSGMMKLGKKLQNPYAVENMRQAWENIRQRNGLGRFKGDEVDIRTTHQYIRFAPQSEEELAVLKADSTLDLYEYPLDVEIEEGGDYYHDPEVPLDLPTYQYASVQIEAELPENSGQVLEDLYIPEEDSLLLSETSSDGRVSAEEIIDELLGEAMRLTNNLQKENESGRTKGGNWRPAGRVRVWDNSPGVNDWRAVEGVEVRARRWFTTHEGRTNAQGFYSCNGTFKEDANYSIDWERYDFAIRKGWLGGAHINGPNREGNWDVDLNNGEQMFYARIFMAAYHYYYKDIKGLRRPPQNGFLKTQMHIRAYDEGNEELNGSHKEERRFLGLGNQIKIYNPQHVMRDIYGTTMHELAHASHWNMWTKGEDFDNSDKIVKESWAQGVEWDLTRIVYPSYTISYGRKKASNSDPFFNYTGVVQDMLDTREGYDQVESYSIKQIEDALRGNKTWNSWRNNIKNTFNNATENNLDALFDYWN